MTTKKKKRVVTRQPASRYLTVVDELLYAQKLSGVPRTVISSMVDIEYVRLDKYMRKERNVSSEEIARKMYAVANILKDLVSIKKLPLGSEINKRNYSIVALDIIDEYLAKGE